MDRGVTRAAFALPGRALHVMADIASGVGYTVATGGRAIFTKVRSWSSVIYARTRFNYRADVGDPMHNSIIAALLGWIARNFPEAPIQILRLTPDGPVAVAPAATGPGAMLRLLERPNPFYAGPVQWAATIIDYMVADAYWFKVRNESGRVVELWWLPAWMVEPRWDESDPTAFIDWYQYTVDGRRFRLEVADVVHFRNGIDPLNPRKGLGRMGSLFRELFTDNEAAALTASLMRNLGVPGVIIAPANTNQGPMRLKPDEIKAKFDDTFGGDGRGGTMVLTRPTEVKILSWSPEQMNLRELRRIPEERAAAVIGIPAGVAGLGAGLDRNTFSNYGEANVAAYTQGVIPLQRNIAAELEVQLLDDFANLEDGYDVVFDWTQVKAMAAFLDAEWRRLSDAATKGLITRADWKRGVGRPVDANGLDDVYIAPNNYLFMPARRPQTAGGQPPTSMNGHGRLNELDLELIAVGAQP